MRYILWVVLVFYALGLSAEIQGRKKKQLEPIMSVVERGLDRAAGQAIRMAASLSGQKGRFPKCIKDGKLATTGYGWWCSGFFPGELWYLYENNPTEELRKYAELFTGWIEPAKRMKSTHDLGFMINCSFGNGYRLTGNEKYREVMLCGARSLYSRYSKSLGLVRSWDFARNKWQYPVIIDNMMNLEYLMWASRAGGNNRFREAALSHAEKTMEHHFRKDNSCWHVVSYDTLSGLPHVKQTHQGYADASAWARGQAWALYGFTMMYRESGKAAFLDQARIVAAYLMDHPRMPEDKVPYWDFDAPRIPKEPRDASAAAIMASALVELGQAVGGEAGKKYIAYAEDQIRSLTSEAYLAAPGGNCNFALMHSTGNKPGNSEVDTPLSYADYYYVEALIRLKKIYRPEAFALPAPEGMADRRMWVETATRISGPVLRNLAANTLRKNMPYVSKAKDRKPFACLEAAGRVICGISPWLELGPDDTEEGRLRAEFIDLAVKALTHAVDSTAPDYLDFNLGSQSLVDAAFLVQGLLRAPRQLWGRLDEETKRNMVRELKSTRSIRPSNNNWLLFTSIVEAGLLEFTGECDMGRLMYGVRKFRDEWYKGDGVYGDGPRFRQDYYNSYVIHPMLTDVLRIMEKHRLPESDFLKEQLKRLTRYALQQERMISPEGTFPVVGRSIAYRFGAFHALAQASLLHLLPEGRIAPGQVRSALSAVIRKQMESSRNFDHNGWLTVGFAGNQLRISEYYINTGSVYLCMSGLLALGLPASDPFWNSPYAEWTNLKAWNGIDIPEDGSIR